MAKKNNPPARPAARPVVEKKEKPSSPRPGGPFFDTAFWKKHWLPVLLIIGTALALYRQAYPMGYVLDDSLVIDENRYTKQGFGAIDSIMTTESMMGYFGKQQNLLEGGRYRPLSIASFAIEVGVLRKMYPTYTIEQILNPHVSHVVNAVLYGLTGALLFGIFLALFPLREGQKWWLSVPFWAAFLFVMHPLHTECVANIKGRDEVLALLGGLGSLWFGLRYFGSDKIGWLVASLVAFLGGVFSKENAIAFAGVVPLTGWFFTRATARQLFMATAILAAGAVFFLVCRTEIIGYFLSSGKKITDLMNNPFADMKGGERLATVFLTLGWYIKLLFVPHPLTHDYYPYHVPKVGWADWRALGSLLIYAGLIWYAFKNWGKRSLISYCILFFLGTMFIVSNIPFSIGAFMNERFVYTSSVAFCLLVAWFLIEKLPGLLKNASFFNENTAKLVGLPVLLLLCGLYTWRTVTRVPDWATALTLNGSAMKTSPESARANCFYAVALFTDLYRVAPDKTQLKDTVYVMERHLRRALEIYPYYSSALQMLPGVVAERYDIDHDLPRLLKDFLDVTEKRPQDKFISDYVNYLKHRGGPEHDAQLVDFCKKAGYDVGYKKFRNPQLATYWLSLGLAIQPNDPTLLALVSEVQSGGRAQPIKPPTN